jgi:large subunit ribosomal protein L3
MHGSAARTDLRLLLGDVVEAVGRGFQGVMKRWNFAGFRATHGTHEYRRHPGAIGQRKTPGRVYPNKKLPGHYGVETVSIQNLSVVDVDVEKGLLLVKGSVPGHINALVYVRPSVKAALRAAEWRQGGSMEPYL